MKKDVHRITQSLPSNLRFLIKFPTKDILTLFDLIAALL